MKAVLDVSLLGQGFYYPKARTGIFRVVENLAALLPEISNELSLYYADTLDLPATLRYIQANIQDKNTHFANTQTQLSRAVFENQLLSLFPLNSVPQKIIKRVLYKLNSHEAVFQEAILSDCSVYHSPYYPIPERVQQKKNIAKLITIHDLIPIKYPQYFENQTENVVHQIVKSIQKDNFAVCVSESTKVDLLEITGIDERQVFVAPLAASSKLFYPVSNQEIIKETLSKYGIVSENPYLLSISTLEPRKNIDTVIKSFAELVSQEKINDLQLVLVGTKGWDFEKIFEAINVSPKVKERIIVTGYVPDEDLAPLYSGALGFVYMSFCEGFGLPPLEAMQCGTPVISSNTTSLPEVIGDAGILVNPTDRNGIAQAMFDLYQNKSLRYLLKEKSIARAGLFSWQKYAKETYQIYQTIG
jgi:glycosyltransferase involved in cell wall biosynthesis